MLYVKSYIFKKNITNNIKSYVKSKYFEIVNNINLTKIRCPHCNALNKFKVHGYYSRKLEYNSIIVEIEIKRLICKNCNHTQAILSSDFIPYIRFRNVEMFSILVEEENNQISYEAVRKGRKLKEMIRKRIVVFDRKITEGLDKLNDFFIFQCKSLLFQNHRGKIWTLLLNSS